MRRYVYYTTFSILCGWSCYNCNALFISILCIKKEKNVGIMHEVFVHTKIIKECNAIIIFLSKFIL